MGFRTTFVTQFITPDEPFAWPDWFYEKWKESVFFAKGYNGQPTTPIASYRETKFYHWTELIEDIQKAIPWDEYERPYKDNIMNNFVIYFAPECGGVECVHITRDKIWTTRPTEWDEDDGAVSGHGDWCHECQWKGCSNNPWDELTPKFEPPPIQTGSYAEKQMLVQAANVIDALMTMGLTPELRDIAEGVVERVKIMYGDQTTTG